MTILFFFVCCVIGGVLGSCLASWSMGKGFIPKALKPKKKVADQAFIEQMDREIFGIEPNGERPQDKPKEIEGLAGYKTRLRKDHDGDLVCELVAPKGGVVETGFVYTTDYADYRDRHKTHLNAAQLEAKVNKKFETLIKEHKVKLARETTLESLMDKFNNKAVEK